MDDQCPECGREVKVTVVMEELVPEPLHSRYEHLECPLCLSPDPDLERPVDVTDTRTANATHTAAVHFACWNRYQMLPTTQRGAHEWRD